MPSFWKLHWGLQNVSVSVALLQQNNGITNLGAKRRATLRNGAQLFDLHRDFHHKNDPSLPKVQRRTYKARSKATSRI